MNWVEEKLLYEAELCAMRCPFCGAYGHRFSECPDAGERYLTRELKLAGRTYYAGSRGFSLGLFALSATLGLAGSVLAGLLLFWLSHR
jgi:hypothetical protein